MRSGPVIISYERPMRVEQVCFVDVGFVECFYFADGCGPSFAGSDMAYSKFSTVLCKM